MMPYRATIIQAAALLACCALQLEAAPFAYITKGSNNKVAVMDIATNSIVGDIAVGTLPLSVAVTATRAYVANAGSSNISVIDTGSNTVVGTIPVAQTGGNFGIAANSTGTRLYISTTNAVSVLDTATGALVSNIAMFSPWAIALNPSGTRAYVANGGHFQVNDGAVTVVDLATNAVIQTIAVGGNVTAIAVSPDGTRVFATDNSNKVLAVIDASTHAVVAKIPVGPLPNGVAVHPAGTRVFVSNMGSTTVSVIDATTNSIVATVNVGPSPYGIALNSTGSRVYVANYQGSSISIIDSASNTVTATVAVPGAYAIGVASVNQAPPPPVFPVTVTGNVTSSTANVTATIQPRPQDVGKNASIFVFAHAPSSEVIGAKSMRRASPALPGDSVPKDQGAVVCVLAQVNASGQLVAVSPSTMQAYLSGVLSAQSQSVQLLNNVATGNVAGATLYVGYGTSAASMLSSGIFQTAISIPGAVQCASRLDSASAAQSPGPLTGLWWNANESGWGIHFTQRASTLFAAWYTYDSAGNPRWYVASNCALPAGNTGTSGTCTGTLYQVSGPVFFGASFDTGLVKPSVAGTLSVSFQDAGNAAMTYNVAGQTRTVAITRQPVGAGSLSAVVDYSDLWWNPSESGWGMAMAQQLGNIFLAWYVYDGSGNPSWYVASNCVISGSACAGTLYRTTGPAFGPSFNPALVQSSAVGSVVVSFIDANNAVVSYTVNGAKGTKTVMRQLF